MSRTRWLRQLRAACRRRLDLDRAGGEAGAMVLFMVIFVVAAFAMSGLVVDGGAALATRERAADLAVQTARAGANALQPTVLRGNRAGSTLPNPAAAQLAVRNFLRAAGARGHATVDGQDVKVEVTVTRHTVLLSAIGVDDISQTATATARPLTGTSTRTGG